MHPLPFDGENAIETLCHWQPSTTKEALGRNPLLTEHREGKKGEKILVPYIFLGDEDSRD
jgi:hypothetical protein